MAHELEIIDGNAQMFSVREIPWHSLGKVISDAPTMQEGIKLAGLDWTVRQEPMFLQDGRITSRKAIVRDTDNRILGYGANDWTPLQNSEAFGFFAPFLDSNQVSLETAGSLYNGSRIWVLAKIKDVVGEVIKDDPIQRYFMLTNAHTSGFSVNVGFTDIRIVCKNTQEMAERSANSKLMRVTHSKNLSLNLKDVQDTINMSKRAFEADLEKLSRLTRKGINQEMVKKFVDQVFFAQVIDWKTASERMKTNRSQTLDAINSLMDCGSGSDLQGVKGTAYGLYQATTEYLTHHDGKTSENRLQKLWMGANQTKSQTAMKLLLVA